LVEAEAPGGKGAGGGKQVAAAGQHKSAEQHLAAASSDIGDLFEGTRSYLLGLGDDVQVKPMKFYFAFKRIKNFACVELRNKKKNLLVYVKVDPDVVKLEKDFTRDVRKIGHFGTGDLAITLRSMDDLERAKPLLLKSYEAS